MKMFVWLFIAVVILIVVFGVSVFNKLVRARNQAKNGAFQRAVHPFRTGA